MKLKKRTRLALYLGFALIAQQSFAEEAKIIGSTPIELKSEQQASLKSPKASGTAKESKVIQLLHLELSEEAKERLALRAKEALAHTHHFRSIVPSTNNSPIPNQVQLAMNGVPVLDQGPYGTCVTFAVTGGLDAIIGKGDYISQLCSLTLGTYLQQHGYIPYSGWYGSLAVHVLNQIDQYGVIDIESQKKMGCAGLRYYPGFSPYPPRSFIEPEEYRSRSELIFGTVANWSNIYQSTDPTQTLNEVKTSLNAGNRIVFGVLFPRTDLGVCGAVGRHKNWIEKDTWVLTPSILKGVEKADAGHEMIITGYDDQAVATDDQGKKHTGLLTLRNSWGSDVGNYGEFYMSYDYFKLLALEAAQLSPEALAR